MPPKRRDRVVVLLLPLLYCSVGDIQQKLRCRRWTHQHKSNSCYFTLVPTVIKTVALSPSTPNVNLYNRLTHTRRISQSTMIVYSLLPYHLRTTFLAFSVQHKRFTRKLKVSTITRYTIHLALYPSLARGRYSTRLLLYTTDTRLDGISRD